MNNVIAFPERPKLRANATAANACARATAAVDNVIDLQSVRAEDSNWIYGRWDVRELPANIEDWPRELLVLAAADMQESARRWDEMVAEDMTAHRAKFRVVK